MRIAKFIVHYETPPKKKRLKAAGGQGVLSFTCNVCGEGCSAKVMELGRETPSCTRCGSTVRFRSIVHLLSMELFGKSLALPDFPDRPDIQGAGLSDWDGYAVGLARKLGYQNTYYHQAPKLDITNIDSAQEGTLDFIISSDVFEHVNPPVSIAFENVRRLLKPGGVFIFTVPFTKNPSTTEHYPELFDFQVLNTDGKYTLRNVTRDGRVQLFDNLVFHGGPGATLEMRIFSERSVIDELENAGMVDVKVHRAPDFDHGIYFTCDWSLPVSARAA